VTTTATRTTTMTTTTAVPKRILKGIGYAPVPLRGRAQLLDDDFMSANASSLWGPKGRGDLGIMRAMGANTVRLYGNDPSLDHRPFLDEALAQGLQVVAGLSDYPYTQMAGSCMKTDLNCFWQVKEQYAMNLKRGFLTSNKTYHPALGAFILMNEPDLKFNPITQPWRFCKALVSAFDAVLDAERESNILGPMLNLTVSFSFAVCPDCKQFGSQPGLGQMAELRQAMKHPELLGYVPKNNIWEAYQQRFVNSVNTANPAADIRHLFLDGYDASFPGVPIFISEYHSPRLVSQQADMKAILAIAERPSTMLVGIFFFEYQVRYDKGGSEMDFGMFGLGSRGLGVLRIKSAPETAWCLTPMKDPETGELLPQVITEAFGGPGVDFSKLCSASDSHMAFLKRK